MSSGLRKVAQGEFLFKEGDPPDAMYVIKSGKFDVVKAKGQSEIKLAELGPGSMVGEMAFFDNKPRSASVKATRDGEAIVLPYKALHSQFVKFPEWTKAIMKTVNEHLRKANHRIKELEKTAGEDDIVFPPHTMNKLISIFSFVTFKFAQRVDSGYEINSNVVRKYTIQIFQEATHKMNKLVDVLEEQKILKTENTGDGNQKITVFQLQLLFEFVEWHNKHLFQKEEERFTIEEGEIKIINGLLYFARKIPPNDKGLTKINLTEVQNDSMKEIGDLIRVDDVNGLISKKVLSDKQMESNGIFVFLDLAQVEKLSPFWTLIYALKKVNR
jgi:CRP/FNR family transcriptional regulator, cyclic AMP receptor protein